MTKLETMQGVLLSKILKNVSPIKYTSNRQVNKLLDGTYHVQIIGEPLKTIDAVIISNFIQAERLSYLTDRGEEFLFYHLGKKYLVHIDNPIKWVRLNYSKGNGDKSFYEGKLDMVIKEEVIM